jgi:AraC-like DNA-binding protein
MNSAALHYATVAAAIRFVRSHARQQPALDAIAAHVGLSPAHLQRVFVAWVGISPKRFVQFLTRQHAKASLGRRTQTRDDRVGTGADRRKGLVQPHARGVSARPSQALSRHPAGAASIAPCATPEFVR